MESTLKEIVVLLVLLLVSGLVLNGCSDEIGTGPDKKDYNNVFMPQARQNPSNHSVRFVSELQTIEYGAVYGGIGKAEADIPVHFDVDPSLVNQFNTKNSTSYDILPKDSYELSKKDAKIPAGYASTTGFNVKLHILGNIESGVSYLLPVTLDVDDSSNTPVDEKLQTAYFLVQGSLTKYDRSDWEILDFDSQQNSAAFAASNILDDDLGTIWLTEYTPSTPTFPHYVSIDMGKENTLSKFELHGRSNFKLSNPKEVTIKFSDDGNNWKDGEDFTLGFSETKNKTSVSLSTPVKARYFRIKAKNAVGSSIPFVSLGEVYAY